MEENWAQSDYLGGKVVICQPNEGYRAGLDAVMLAAAMNHGKGEKVLDVGCGVGTVMLCSAWRNKETFYTGIDIQENLIKCAQHNIKLNKRLEFCDVFYANILDKSKLLKPQTFDHVMTNPPYYQDKASRKSPYESKAIAHVEEISLKDWLAFSIKMLKPRGTFSMIYPMERLDEVLSHLYKKIGEISLFPLWPKQGEPAKRVLIQGRKQIQSGLKLLPGLVLHETNGDNTLEATKVLRDGEVLAQNFLISF